MDSRLDMKAAAPELAPKAHHSLLRIYPASEAAVEVGTMNGERPSLD